MSTRAISPDVHAGGISCTGGRISPFRAICFGLVCASPILIAWRLMRMVFELALGNDTYTHIPLIPLVSLFLIYANRKTVFAASGGWKFGGVLLFGDSRHRRGEARRFSTSNCQSALPGGVRGSTCVDRRFRAFFWFCGISRRPFSIAVLAVYDSHSRADSVEDNSCASGRKRASRRWPFWTLWNPVFAGGTRVLFARRCNSRGGRMQRDSIHAGFIDHDCPGEPHVFKGHVEAASRLSAGRPLSVAKNGLRIAALSTLAIYVDPGFLHGRLHQYGGMFFFAAAFVPLAAIFLLLEKGEARKPA